MPPVQYLPSPWPLSFLHGSNRHIHLDSLKGDASIPGQRRVIPRSDPPRSGTRPTASPSSNPCWATPRTPPSRTSRPLPSRVLPRARLPRRCDSAPSPPTAPRSRRRPPPRPRPRLRGSSPLLLVPPATASKGRSPRSARLTSCTTRPCLAQSGGSRSGGIARRLRRPRGTTH